MSKHTNQHQEFVPRSRKRRAKKNSKLVLILFFATFFSIVIAITSVSYALGYWNTNQTKTSTVTVLETLEGRPLTSSEHTLKNKPTLLLYTEEVKEEEEEGQSESVIEEDSEGDKLDLRTELNSESEEKVQKEAQIPPNPTTPQEELKQDPIHKQPEIVLNHVVKSKETLFSITMRYFKSSSAQEKIAQFNGITNPSTDIKAGITLKIPDPDLLAVHEIKSGETLYSITRHYYNTTEHLISLANYNGVIDPTKDVQVGRKLEIPHPNVLRNNQIGKYTIHINKTKNTLTVYRDSSVVRSFSVATGKQQSITPEGVFQIVNKVEKPWYNPKNIPGGAPENPLGSHWLGLNVPGTNNFIYGIHGTNDPSSIGKYVSLGCIRMHNSDVLWMYDNIPLHTTVYIFSE